MFNGRAHPLAAVIGNKGIGPVFASIIGLEIERLRKIVQLNHEFSSLEPEIFKHWFVAASAKGDKKELHRRAFNFLLKTDEPGSDWTRVLIELIKEETLRIRDEPYTDGPGLKITPLVIALAEMHNDIPAFEDHYKPILMALLEKGARVDVTLDDDETTPLHQAIDLMASHAVFSDHELAEAFVKAAKNARSLAWTYAMCIKVKETPMGPPGHLSASMNALQLALWRQNRLFVDILFREERTLAERCQLTWKLAGEKGEGKKKNVKKGGGAAAAAAGDSAETFSKMVPAWHIPLYNENYANWGEVLVRLAPSALNADSEGDTVLHQLAKRARTERDLEEVEDLLKAVAGPNAPVTPSSALLSFVYVDVSQNPYATVKVRKLVEAKNRQGETALSVVREAGMAKLLLTAGANVHSRNAELVG
uniref:Uncharacterized protein n=1 Tax=Chromera velia CCMP2878 TaxID=1169474 RepID=A0A0G4IF49_9ALVE|eukprot:Cvel_13783.t1-p1 / transcript=Cvel_13783.t1 / gene=Cvel_13783 / organism=Chromera_velia_CCMP2878 / gene_product=hypothetical protein / transcript_product=hypothetical protein / location=Cvel_scaffold955:22242-23669(+) / protein_length=420 / sequence_SO=supercontig / SO=protein_coding / is_pseudo=false